MFLKRLLAHPSTRGLDLDAPETTAIRREIVRSKPFLRALYLEWYAEIIMWIPKGPGDVVELGAGGGFMKDELPELITSDLLPVPGVDDVVDAQSMPFEDGSLRAITMTNVFHHIPNVGLFLTEATRTLRPGGRVIMIEPWNTAWSRFVHKRFHHEPMVPDAETWQFPGSGPLSGANAALPWIVVERDRRKLEAEWPQLAVKEVRPFMPFRYLASGGVSMRALQPLWTFRLWKGLERGTGAEEKMAVFALIVLERSDGQGTA